MEFCWHAALKEGFALLPAALNKSALSTLAISALAVMMAALLLPHTLVFSGEN
jgi:hypothetical protein